MSTFVVGDCVATNLFQIWDADAALETEFEYIVAKALMCVYPNYHCILFGGTFKLENQVSRPDLALVAKDFSHWFVIEVELISHSLEGHVLPQIRTFRYGEPQPDCVSVLKKVTGLEADQIRTFLKTIPRSVAVVVNKRSKDWEMAFKALQVQMLTVTAYSSPTGIRAVEVDGRLTALQEHLGYGLYFATDRSLRYPQSVKLPNGEVMIDDFTGTGSLWTVRRDTSFAWVTKNTGVPDITNGTMVQTIRAFGGRISIRSHLR